MGTTLTGLTPATTYDALIKVGDNGPLSATAKYVGDGLGNDSVVALSTSSVGIGTTSPTQLLHVAGNVRITGALYDGNNATGTSGQILSSTGTATDWVSKSDLGLVDGSGTANFVSKWSDTGTLTNSLIFDNGTNVGIGTTAPDSRLHVSGTMRTVLTSGAGGQTLLCAISGVSNGYLINVDASNNITHNWHTGANATSLFISSAGSVGIGTSNPTQKLEVQDGAAGAAIKVSNSGGGSAQLAISSNATSVATLSFTNSLSLTGGNVGIGTSSPAYKLDVNGTGRFSNQLNIPTNVDIAYGNLTGDYIGQYYNGTNLLFYNGTGGSNFLSITRSTGNVGIGTASPASKLDVNGNIATSGDIILTGAKGIYFDNAASKYLDDYEVGTWTPVINGGGGNPTVTYSAFNTGGIYTKIGNQVTVSFEVRWSAISGGSGGVAIAGLPFARRTTSLPDGDRLIIDSYDNTISGKYLTGSIGSGNSSIAFSMVNSAAAPTDLVVSDLSTSGLGFLRGTATYFV
jgi:hypothetical protein